MRPPPVFAAYCVVVLLLFTVAKYRGMALFGSSGLAEANAAAGGSRAGGGSYGSHK